MRLKLLLFLALGVVMGSLAVTITPTRLNAVQIINLPGGAGLAIGFGLINVGGAAAVNTALLLTHDQNHANENFCSSTNGTTAYTCALANKPLLSYSRGQAFLVEVDTTCAAGCSLNVDGNGPKIIKKSDGLTDPQGTLIAGEAQWVWFDGTIFRLVG